MFNLYMQFNYDQKSREIHDKISMIENLVWEAAKLINESAQIDAKKVKNATQVLMDILR
jgi:hypothetical protein